MAETGDPRSDSAKSCEIAAKTTSEMRRELARLVKTITEQEGDEFSVDTVEEAITVLHFLWESTSKKPRLGDRIRLHFYCPISHKVMMDPVVLENGQTFDRTSIEDWLMRGRRKCPQTQQPLLDTRLTPNHLVREVTIEYFKEQGQNLPNLFENVDTNTISTNPSTDYFEALLERMASSPSDQGAAAKELRHLTGRLPTARAFFVKSVGSIRKLLNPLSLEKTSIDLDFQEDLITIILNLSVPEGIQSLMEENILVICFLIESFKLGTDQTRSNAAAALSELSTLDSNKCLIGELGGVKPLINLIKEGSVVAVSNASSALYNLCLFPNNSKQAIQEQVTRVILDRMTKQVCIDGLLILLAFLCRDRDVLEELSSYGTVTALLDLLRKISDERSKENCVDILHAICYHDQRTRRHISLDETANGTLSRVAETGTARARRKATSILAKIPKFSMEIARLSG